MFFPRFNKQWVAPIGLEEGIGGQEGPKWLFLEPAFGISKSVKG